MANDFLGPVNPNATAGSNDEWWTNAQTQNAAAAGGPQYTYAQPGPWAGGYVFDSPQPGAGGDYYVSAPWSPAPADTPIYDAQTPQLLPADNPATPWDPWAQFNAQPGAGAWNDPWQPAAGGSGMGVGSGAWNDPLTGNGPQANGWGSPYSVPLSNPPLTPFPLASSGNGAQAPDWMAAPDTWLGQQERNIFRPDANLIERGGAVLGAIGGGLGALAQGVEGLLGGIGSNLPRVKTSPMLSIDSTSLAQTVQEQADALGKSGSAYLDAMRNDPLNRPFGDTSDTALATYAVRNIMGSGIGKSGVENPQAQAAARILAGEDPTVAMRGAEKPGANAYADETVLWEKRVGEYVSAAERLARAKARKDYANDLTLGYGANGQRMSADVYEQARAEQAKAEAARVVQATGHIPGAENPLAEMAVNMALDPLNFTGFEGLSVFKKAQGITQAEQGATVLMEAGERIDEAYKAVRGLAPMGRVESAVMEKAATQGGVWKTLDKVFESGRSLLERTPATEAKIRAGTAFKQIGTITLDAGSADEAAKLLRMYVENPQGMMDVFGRVPVSVEAEIARPVLRDALAEIEKMAKATPAAAGFDPARWLADISPVLEKAANAVAGFNPDAPVAAWQKYAQKFKGWMSEFYLKTPGYIARNFVSDNTIAMMDGLRMFENMGNVERDLQKFGATTERIAGRVGGLLEDTGGATSKLAGVPIIGDIQTKLGQIADKAERTRYTRAYHSALMDVWGTNWRPELSDTTRALFEQAGIPEAADELSQALKGAMSGKDLRRVVEEWFGAETPAERFFVTQYIDRADDLPTELAAQVEKQARTMAQNGASADDVRAYMDGLIEQVRKDATKKGMNIDAVLNPSTRHTTTGDYVQDIEELQRQLEQGLAGLVNRGSMTREQAVQIMDEELRQFRAQTKELHEARGNLAQVFRGGTPANAGGEVDVITHATAYEMERRETARLANDAEWKRIMQGDERFSRAAWDGYRNARNEVWNAAHGDIVSTYGKAGRALDELRGGARPAADVLAGYGIESGTARAERALAAVRERAAASASTFEGTVNTLRARYDAAQNELARQAARTVEANPELGQDVVDVLLSVKRDTDKRFDRALTYGEVQLARKDASEITLAEYSKLMDAEWQSAFEFARARWTEYGQAQLRGLELGRSGIAQDLQSLGYTGDELKRLVGGVSDGSTRAEVQQIVSERRVAARASTPMPTPSPSQQEGNWGNVLKPPEDVAAWLGNKDPEEALRMAEGLRDQASQLAGGTGKLEALQAAEEGARAQGFTPDVVNRWLKPDGNPKTMNGKSWLDAPYNRVDEAAKELGYDDLNAFYAKLKETQDTRRSLAAIKSGGKKALASETDAATQAVEKWDGVIQELKQRAAYLNGESADIASARSFVQQQVKQKGIAEASDIVKAVAGGGDPASEVMLEELRTLTQTAIDNDFERVDDIAQGFGSAVNTMRDAYFGSMDIGQKVKAMDKWMRENNLSYVDGLLREWQVEVMNKMGVELGLDPARWTKGERTMSEVVAAAREANPTLVDDVLRADVVKKDGRIKKEQWDFLVDTHGLTGERRQPGEVLRELAGTPAHPPPLSSGGGTVALRGWSGNKGMAKAEDTLAGVGDQVFARDTFGRITGIEGDKITVMVRGKAEVFAPDELRFVEAQRGVAREKATLPLVADALPQPIHTSEVTPEQLAELDRLAERHGRAEPPGPLDLLAAHEKRTIGALEKIRDGLAGKWDTAISGVPNGARAAVEADLKRIGQEFFETRAAAISHAQARADFSLLNYADKRGIDMGIAAFAPYSFWGTRQGRNFLIRAAEKPGLIAQYVRYKDAQERENARRGYRKRFTGGFEVPLPSAISGKLGMPAGASLMVDPLMWLFPFAGMIDEGNADDSRSALASVYAAAGQFGFRAAPYIDLPLRYMNLLVDAQPGTPEYDKQVADSGRGSIGNVIPQTQMLKAGTALLGVGPAGGVDLERPMRTALGMNESGRFESYNVARAVRDMASEANMQRGTGFDNQAYLLAQAFIAGQDEQGWADLLSTTTPEQLAGMYQVPLVAAQQALQIVRDAAGRAGKQGGVQTLASGLAGISAKVLPQGEKDFLGMQQAERGAGYNPLTGYGSRADLLDARKRYPALAVGSAQYGTLAGESETQPLALYRSSARAEINAAFDKLKDDTIRSRPWDKGAASGVETARQKALATLQPQTQGTADWRTIYAQAAGYPNIDGQDKQDVYRPRSVAGATPREVINIRREELMGALNATAPKPAQFDDGKGVDWEAYNAARTQWLAAVPLVARKDASVLAVLRQAAKDSPDAGMALASFAQGVTGQMVENYLRRNDTPQEAAQRAYFDLVYTPAQDKYQAAKQSGLTGAKLSAAYDAAVKSVPPQSTGDLIALVQRAYPGKWSDEELRAALGGMTMPSAFAVQRANMSASARASAEKTDATAALKERAKREAAAAYTAQVAGFEKTVAQTYGVNALNLYKQYLAASGTTKTKMGKNGTVAAVKKYAEMFGEKNAAFKKSYGKKK